MAIATRAPSIRFGADGSFSGSTGVNRMFGRFVIDGERIEFGAAGTTRMAGSPEAMAVESRFLAAINLGGAIELDGDTLRIGSGETQVVLRSNVSASRS
jgi:heat shock protein HslJ